MCQVCTHFVSISLDVHLCVSLVDAYLMLPRWFLYFVERLLDYLFVCPPSFHLFCRRLPCCYGVRIFDRLPLQVVLILLCDGIV